MGQIIMVDGESEMHIWWVLTITRDSLIDEESFGI